MEEIASNNRYNLYYIFAQDKLAHPMPPHKAEALRSLLLTDGPPKPDVPP